MSAAALTNAAISCCQRRNLASEYNLRLRLVTAPHSPARFRVDGVVTNLEGFYAVFGVDVGDKLYRTPADRVKIW